MSQKIRNLITKEKNTKNEKFIKLNGMFSYETDGETAHIHMPESMKKQIEEKGLRYAIENASESLFDALQKITKISEKNSEIKKVFAVSPLLSQNIFRERLEILGFRIEPADEKFEKIFPNKKNLCQASIPIERLKQVLEVEKEARDGMDTQDKMWHRRVLYYKYEQLKRIGIIDYYNIPLDKIIELGEMNYNFRHGLSLETKEKRNEQFDARIKQNKITEKRETIVEIGEK